MTTLNEKQAAELVRIQKEHGDFDIEQVEEGTRGFVFVFATEQIESILEIDTFGTTWIYGTNNQF